MTAALKKALPKIPMSTSAILIGSVAPDIPLYLLSIGGIFYYEKLLGWTKHATFHHMFHDLFFHDPYWIICHNTLHAPLVLIAGLIFIRVLKGKEKFQTNWFTWFFAACLLHSVVDIFTHHDDGPLLFFPFNWHYRFISPVSYWDSKHYGFQFSIFEIIFDIALLCYLVIPFMIHRIKLRSTKV